MQLKSLPTWGNANRFQLSIEKSGQALREKHQKCEWSHQLKYCLDEIKIQLHLAKKLEAMPIFSTFEYLSLRALEPGKQNGQNG